MNKLIVIIMGPGKKHFAEMCLDSVKNADKILYWTSNEDIDIDIGMYQIFNNGWDETDPQTNGKCRQRYLKYLKENYPNDWCLVLDEDEIVEDIDKIKEFIQVAQMDIYNVKMRHLIGNLGYEDDTVKEHWVPNRLFKISKANKYPNHSHPVLKGIKNYKQGNVNLTTIWHCGHLPVEYMDYILKRYKEHINNSIIHSKEYLDDWRDKHFFGVYQTKQISPLELPKQLLDRYELNKDYYYFMNDVIEAKHVFMVKQWFNYFKPKSILDLGCGRGIYLHFWSWFVKKCVGIEKNKTAIDMAICKKLIINQDILKLNLKNEYDLVIAFDVLEHIEYKNIDKAIEVIKTHAKKNILISIPFLGDPNLDADSTHIIKEDKDWWLSKFKNHQLKLIKTPEDFMYGEQILIFKK